MKQTAELRWQSQTFFLTLMLLIADLANTKWCKKHENDWNPGSWVLISAYSVRAFQWLPTWQGLDGFQKSLHPCALDESNLSTGKVKGKWGYFFFKHFTNCSYTLKFRSCNPVFLQFHIHFPKECNIHECILQSLLLFFRSLSNSDIFQYL